MSSNPQSVMVSSDNPVLLKELLAKARQIADAQGWAVSVLPLDQDLQSELPTLGAAGADMVYSFDGVQLDGNPDTRVAILAEAIRQVQPALVLIGATQQGMEAAPRAAERVGAGYGAWTAGIEVDGNSCEVTAKCALYTGLGLASYHFKTPTTLLTVAPGVFKGLASAAREAKLVPLALSISAPRVRVVEIRPKGVGSSRLEEARAVVDVGQGVKKREDLSLIESVAEALDGQLACSRPVASDRDWFPEWLGLSGKKVSPEVCLALGISGAVQHIVGIRDSRVIVAVNNDENAGIFSQVDYGVVADLYEFLPVFIERLKARKVRPVWKAA